MSSIASSSQKILSRKHATSLFDHSILDRSFSSSFTPSNSDSPLEKEFKEKMKNLQNLNCDDASELLSQLNNAIKGTYLMSVPFIAGIAVSGLIGSMVGDNANLEHLKGAAKEKAIKDYLQNKGFSKEQLENASKVIQDCEAIADQWNNNTDAIKGIDPKSLISMDKFIQDCKDHNLKPVGITEQQLTQIEVARAQIEKSIDGSNFEKTDQNQLRSWYDVIGAALGALAGGIFFGATFKSLGVFKSLKLYLDSRSKVQEHLRKLNDTGQGCGGGEPVPVSVPVPSEQKNENESPVERRRTDFSTPVTLPAFGDSLVPSFSRSLQLDLPRQPFFNQQPLMPNLRAFEQNSVPSMRGLKPGEFADMQVRERMRVQQMQTDANALFAMMFVVLPAAVVSGGSGVAGVANMSVNGAKTVQAAGYLKEAFAALILYGAASSDTNAASSSSSTKARRFSVDKTKIAQAYSMAVVDAYRNYSGDAKLNPLDIYEYVTKADIAKYGNKDKAITAQSVRRAKLSLAKRREERLEAIRVDAFDKIGSYVEEALPVLNRNYAEMTRAMNESLKLDPMGSNPQTDPYRADILKAFADQLNAFRQNLMAGSYQHTPPVADYNIKDYFKF